MSREDVTAVRDALDRLGPFGLLSALGVVHKREGAAARFCCPRHRENTASATLRLGPEGSLRWHCFGPCDCSADALALIAEVRGLDVRSRFREVLQEAADLGGVRLEDRFPDRSAGNQLPRSLSKRRNEELPDQSAGRYPADAFDLWTRCTPVDRDAEVSTYLAGRAIDAAAVARLDLARVLPACNGYTLPRWCWGPTGSWATSGHRLVVPCLDAHGALRSLRASLVRVQTGQTVRNGGLRRDLDSPHSDEIRVASPKRLAPAGHTCSGLVFCNPAASVLLSNPRGAAEDMRAAFGEVRVLVVEGEPDFLTASIAWPTWPIVGVFSGSWSPAIAARIPEGARVVIRTHTDTAGEKYADEIARSLEAVCNVERAAA